VGNFLIQSSPPSKQGPRANDKTNLHVLISSIIKHSLLLEIEPTKHLIWGKKKNELLSQATLGINHEGYQK